MAIQLLVLMLALMAMPYSSAQQTKEIYISPSGVDTATGTLDEPFNTLQRAYDEIISLDPTKYRKVTVWINNGTYHIKAPLVIDSKFQKGDMQVDFKAVGESQPVISGAERLKDWSSIGNNIWVSPISQEIGRFRELFINGKRATRARHPNKDFLRVKKVGADRRTHFTFNSGDFPIPENEVKTELVLLHDWSITRIPVKHIDTEKHELAAIDSIGAKTLDFFNLDNWESQPRFYLENAREFLDAPFEWFLDTKTSRVYLKLPPKSNPNSLSVEIPRAEGLLQLRGTEQQLISNISFEGIVFKYCRWNMPEQTYAGIQACHFDPRGKTQGWNVVPAAVEAIWAENIRFENCAFASMGGSAVWFGTGSRNCALKKCRIRDISGNGVMIGEGQDRLVDGGPWWKTAPEQVALANKVEASDISDCGKQFYGAVGIWCGLTAETLLADNKIYNLPYTGISVGWMWSPEATPCRDNHIEQNHIHHIMQTLSDGGGIYMLGLQPGSRLIDNLIHDISINAGRAESNGMFLDEGTKDVVVENNLIYNVAKSPLRFHRASTNLVKGNYFFSKGKTPGITYNNTIPEDINKQENFFTSTENPKYSVILEAALSKFNRQNQPAH